MIGEALLSNAELGLADRVAVALREVPGVASVADPVVNQAGDTAIVTVFPTTSPQS